MATAVLRVVVPDSWDLEAVLTPFPADLIDTRRRRGEVSEGRLRESKDTGFTLLLAEDENDRAAVSACASTFRIVKDEIAALIRQGAEVELDLGIFPDPGDFCRCVYFEVTLLRDLADAGVELAVSCYAPAVDEEEEEGAPEDS